MICDARPPQQSAQFGRKQRTSFRAFALKRSRERERERERREGGRQREREREKPGKKRGRKALGIAQSSREIGTRNARVGEGGKGDRKLRRWEIRAYPMPRGGGWSGKRVQGG